MTFNLKMAAAALGMTAMLAGATATMPTQAVAQDAAHGYDYDGFCYVKKSDLAGKDAALGAIGGAIAGNLLSKKGDKTKGALEGAAVGGAAGFVIGKNSKDKVRCSKGRYYVYTHGYYAPPEAPRGYKEVYFEDRPENVDLYAIDKKGRISPYRGH